MVAKIYTVGQQLGKCIYYGNAQSLSRNNIRARYADFLCRCGNVFTAKIRDVLIEDTTSCGCFAKENMSRIKKTHGMSGSNYYTVWVNIRQRCYNPNSQAYKNYGGRGIKMCDEWLNSFEQFKKDIGDKPSFNHSLDRIDNDKDYSKDNCRWATRKKQSNNRRGTIQLLYNGEVKSLTEWCECLGINYDRTKSRLRMGWSVEKALNNN